MSYMRMTSTLQSGAVVVFDVPDSTVDDVEPFRIGEWYQRAVGGSGSRTQTGSPVSVSVSVPQAEAGQL